MRRGTTPTHTFTTDIDLTDAEVIYITYKQDGKVDKTKEATETELGLVKLNPDESVTLNSSGQLDVGGRLGQFSGTTGIYHSKDRAPRNVADFSFLITDAMGMDLSAPRSFALVTGANLTLNKSHAAGSTTYTVANNYANRIICSILANGGYASQNEAYSKENRIVKVTSVTIGGKSFTPDSSPDSGTPITITTQESANPTAAVSQIRIFGGVTAGYCSEYIGQCVGGAAGVSLVIGQRVICKSGNVNIIIAADVYNNGNGNAIFGRQHISRKNRWFLSGTGHDTTNGRNEAGAAVGQWSYIDENTIFAVGIGSSPTSRQNAFEVVSDGFVLRSPNGNRWKVTVSDSGALTTTAL